MAPQPAANESVESISPPHHPPDAFFVRLVRGWVWLSALAGLAGWSLSALGQLNRTGYAVCLGAMAGIYLLYWRHARGTDWRWPDWKRWVRRFRRPLPGAFAVLALLVLTGSSLYAPSNYTGLNYHLGRVLQWIAHGQWWWIHTPVVRMNYSGCAFEWLTTPVVLFTKSDRALFLVNFIPFLLLPGLIFSAFTRLGVGARTAWHWMWLLPTGYNLLLQSGSIGNDAFSAVYALAALDFGARAWKSRRLRDFWCSLLAVGLMTGVKPVSLPLLLPWLILVFPLWRLLRRHWLPTLPVAGLAALASFLPIALMNLLHTGDWLARNTEVLQKNVKHPLVAIFGNAFQLLLNNFVPPVFPLAGWWNSHAATLLPQAMVQALNDTFIPGLFMVGEVPSEDFSGLGFGVCSLLAVSLLGSFGVRKRPRQTQGGGPMPWWLGRCVLIAVWVALLVFSMKSELTTGARLITPYYLPLVALLLLGQGQSQITRRRWWRMLAGGVMALALIVLVVSPDRPLWPAKTILAKVLERHPGQAAATRAFEVYTVFSKRNDALAGVRNLLPPNLDAVGFIGDGDDCDISLWRPFGSRRVDHFLLTDPPKFIRARARYVVVGGLDLQECGLPLDVWLRQNHAEVIAATNAVVKISEGPQSWYVTRLRP